MTEDNTTPRALAELARAGYSSMRHPTMDVDFEVHHFGHRPRYLADLFEVKASRNYLETIASSACGAGLVIGINTKRRPGEAPYRDKGGMLDRQPKRSKIDDGFCFSGSARPNLTFLYETGRRFEAIVAIDTDDGPMTMTDAKRLRDLLHKISVVAVETAKAPLLSVQSPVQLPIEREPQFDPEAQFDLHQIPLASSKAVRFAVALPQPNATIGLDVAQSITEYCRTMGFALWLRDTRPGYRIGNWFPVLPLRPGAVHYPVKSEVLDQILPVTFVGPARLGSTHAVLAALSRLSNVGVAGCSITLLDDLAFIHFQLALSRHVNGQLTDEHAVGVDAAAFMRNLAVVAAHPESLGVKAPADDYQTFAGPLLTYVPAGADRRIAIWLSWQMNRAPEGLAVPLRSLSAALKEIKLGKRDDFDRIPEANIEYLVCRDLGNSLFRGKGKLSVPDWFIADRFPRPGVEPSPSQLCVALEDAWKAAAAAQQSPANIREITVSWREHWLGHWAVPISS